MRWEEGRETGIKTIKKSSFHEFGFPTSYRFYPRIVADAGNSLKSDNQSPKTYAFPDS